MKRLISVFIYVGLIVFVLVAVNLYRSLFKPVKAGEEGIEIVIPRDSEYEDVKDILSSVNLMVNEKSFDLLSKRKKYPGNIKPGRYIISDEMSYNDILNLLRAGNQTPVKLTFNNIRTLADLASRISVQLAIDSTGILSFLENEKNYSADGFTRATIMAVFLPDTYEMYWTATAEDIYARMLKEFNDFWNSDRLSKARAIGLSPVEVSTLASIVDDEVLMEDEKPKIAGVYLNRLKINMPLQACPTIKFALNDFTIRRVLNEHLTVDSPYNTYMYRGLPPGPVQCATKSGINAVLNAEDHDFLYFVARYDFSGYHHFSQTLSEHNAYARKYQSELNSRRIYN
ncbi:MAG: endolytic transglycosylase MltG [Marinilabiliaceae bacterium]|jgi:UPF0755 protein|nr:endolytic transglycosylase MltG [Marinilabiliaceae bacterium]